ncbi:WD40 repeat domain-containing protein [Paludisphaera sp.]|uniref:WD40 repeat domain-containing protein n=1 Tax=Paludisphaera sp. TaxID=2017432 RepID=UPI00301E1091
MSLGSLGRLACGLALALMPVVAAAQTRPGVAPSGKAAPRGAAPLPARSRAVLRGHEKEAQTLAFSPDGKFLVSGSHDGTVRRWDPATGREIGRFKMPGDSPILDAVAVSIDGKTVAACATDGGIATWDVATSKPGETYDQGQVVDILFMPDGARLASGDFTSVSLWDLATGEETAEMEPQSTVQTLAASPDGKLVAWGAFSNARPNEVAVWDLAADRAAVRLKDADIRAYDVEFSPDGKTLAVCGLRDTGRKIEGISIETTLTVGVIKLWDVATGAIRAEYDAERNRGQNRTFHDLSYSPDGSLIALGTSENVVEIWEVSPLRKRGELKGHTDYVRAVAFSPDGKTLGSASDDRTIRLWDVPTAPATRPALTPGAVAKPGEIRRFEGHRGGVAAAALSRDGRVALSGGEDGELRAWDVATGKLLHGMKGHSGSIAGVALSPDGKRALSGGTDRTVRLWDLSAGRELRTLEGHASAVACVAFAPDGRRAVSGGDRELILWDLDAGKPALRFADLDERVRAVAVTPDGRLALTGGDAKAFRAWDMRSGRRLMNLEGHEEPILAVAPAPDVQLAATGGDDDSVSLWNLQGGEEGTTIAEEHEGGVTAVALARGGRLLTGAGDGMIRLWDGPRGKLLLALEGHAGAVASVAISPDGRAALSAGADGTVRLWSLTTAGR